MTRAMASLLDSTALYEDEKDAITKLVALFEAARSVQHTPVPPRAWRIFNDAVETCAADHLLGTITAKDDS